MPSILNLNFLEWFPIPSLKNYVGFSLMLLIAMIAQAYYMVWDKNEELDGRLTHSPLTNSTKTIINQSQPLKMLFYSINDQSTVWVLINSLCCVSALFGNMLMWGVFGKLRNQEQQQMRDRFWNFIFYKFVFVFGVLYVQYLDEAIFWCVWLIIVGLFYILTTLAQDRFKYLSSWNGNRDTRTGRLIGFLSFATLVSSGLFAVSVYASTQYGLSYGGFLAADATQLVVRSLYCLLRYGLHWRGDLGDWDRKHNIVYYSEFIFHMSILSVDFLHHLHMLFWSNITISMACLVIGLQLRQLYIEMDRRIKKHKHYRRIISHIESNFTEVSTGSDHQLMEDPCAICWEQMSEGRKLPCDHIFHAWCLRSWLEQDPSCPTCRSVLPIRPEQPPGAEPGVAGVAGVAGVGGGGGVGVGGGAGGGGRPAMSHFFHFDGERYARWLPSFSVEFSHNIGIPFPRQRTQTNSQLNSMAETVEEMFPDIDREAIIADLEDTHSIEATIENILERRLNPPEMIILGEDRLTDEEEFPGLDEFPGLSRDANGGAVAGGNLFRRRTGGGGGEGEWTDDDETDGESEEYLTEGEDDEDDDEDDDDDGHLPAGIHPHQPPSSTTSYNSSSHSSSTHPWSLSPPPSFNPFINQRRLDMIAQNRRRYLERNGLSTASSAD